MLAGPNLPARGRDIAQWGPLRLRPPRAQTGRPAGHTGPSSDATRSLRLLQVAALLPRDIRRSSRAPVFATLLLYSLFKPGVPAPLLSLTATALASLGSLGIVLAESSCHQRLDHHPRRVCCIFPGPAGLRRGNPPRRATYACVPGHVHTTPLLSDEVADNKTKSVFASIDTPRSRRSAPDGCPWPCPVSGLPSPLRGRLAGFLLLQPNYSNRFVVHDLNRPRHGTYARPLSWPEGRLLGTRSSVSGSATSCGKCSPRTLSPTCASSSSSSPLMHSRPGRGRNTPLCSTGRKRSPG